MLENGNLYLTFKLGDETYGLDTAQVYEITSVMNITRVPNTPNFLHGVVNLRGKIIPVIDLRVRLGLEPRARDERTSIIVTKTEHGGGESAIGIEVDAVSEVVQIAAECIDAPPPLGSETTLEFIQNIAKVEENIILILDADVVLGHGNLLDPLQSAGLER